MSSSQVQLEDNAKDILELERQLVELEQQKSEQCNLLKRALTEEDHRKHSQQTVTKEPSWTSLYPSSQFFQFLFSSSIDYFISLIFQIFKWHNIHLIINIIYLPNNLIVY